MVSYRLLLCAHTAGAEAGYTTWLFKAGPREVGIMAQHDTFNIALVTVVVFCKVFWRIYVLVVAHFG